MLVHWSASPVGRAGRTFLHAEPAELIRGPPCLNGVARSSEGCFWRGGRKGMKLNTPKTPESVPPRVFHPPAFHLTGRFLN